MKNLLKLTLFFTLFSAPVWAMEIPAAAVIEAISSSKQPVISPLKRKPSVTFINSHKCNILDTILTKVQEVLETKEENDTVKAIGASPFCGEKFDKTLAKIIKENSIGFSFIAGRGSQKNTSSLEDAGAIITQKSGLHAKYLALKIKQRQDTGSDTEETKSVIQKDLITFVYFGSDNMSDTSKFNHEAGVFLDDTSSFEDLEGIHKTFITVKTPEKKCKAIYKTPEKLTLQHSFAHKLSESKAQRFDKLVTTNNPNDQLFISSMTLDNESFIDSLKKTIEKRTKPLDCTCYFNKDALNHPALLQKLIDLGVKVYIRKEQAAWEGSVIKKIQHSKIFLRIADGKPLVIISTGNLTEQSDKERNIDVIIPNNEELCTEVKGFLNGLVAHSDLLTTNSLKDLVQKIKEQKDASKKKKAAKRKAEQEEIKKAKEAEEQVAETEKTDTPSSKQPKAKKRRLFITQ